MGRRCIAHDCFDDSTSIHWLVLIYPFRWPRFQKQGLTLISPCVKLASKSCRRVGGSVAPHGRLVMEMDLGNGFGRIVEVGALAATCRPVRRARLRRRPIRG